MSTTADATDRSAVEQLAENVADLQETVEQQAKRIEQQAETIERLETEVKIQSSNIGGAHNRISELDDEVSQLEPDSGHETPGVDGDKTGSQDSQTPLERICGLPEHIADRELTVNQERARFVARDVRDYAEKVPAGLVIDSRAIKRVLTASEGKRPHTQTVARVMNFLDDLGKKDVEQKKRRGKKLIVIDPEAATKYTAHHDRCDGESGPTYAEGVISSG
ncbi:hypothetical protein [Halalkalicoccus tibetensis]|uniref:Uncharacterized protein n=1 Tax=Halalkalicoccus tibetensis TaxID=175632 RepID=A0ABD5VC43_9EURY